MSDDFKDYLRSIGIGLGSVVVVLVIVRACVWLLPFVAGP